MERRTTRSDEPEVALHLFLHRTARQQRLAALMIADIGGKLVARSSAIPELEELATMVPKLATQDPQGESLADQLGIPMYFRYIQLQGRQLYLGAIGEESSCKKVLPEVDLGIRRILEEPLCKMTT